MKKYDFKDEELVVSGDSLYRVTERRMFDLDVTYERGERTPGVYLWNDYVVKFEDHDYMGKIKVVTLKDTDLSHFESPENIEEIAVLDRVVPKGIVVCPDCGEGWISCNDESHQMCLECGANWDDPDELKEDVK